MVARDNFVVQKKILGQYSLHWVLRLAVTGLVVVKPYGGR